MDRLFALADRGPGDGRLEAALGALVNERGPSGIDLGELARRLGVLRPTVDKAASMGEVVRIGDRLVASRAIEALSSEILALVEAFHKEHPYKPAIALAEVQSKVGAHVPPEVSERAAEILIGAKKIVRDAEGLRSASRAPAKESNQGAKTKVIAALEGANLEPPPLASLEAESGLSGTAFRDLMASMVRAGEIVHAAQQLYFGKQAFDRAKETVLAFIHDKGEISTAQAKEILGVSRKFLIPVLEAMDKQQITVRVGEVRKAKAPAKKPT